MTTLPLPEPSKLTQPYWDSAGRGELSIQRCQRCSTAFLYPRPWCPNCWSEDVDWEVASGDGVIIGYSVIHQAPYPSYAERVPYVVAVIKLVEGAQMMANMIDCDPADVHVGMAVTVTFERRGDFQLPQFSPLVPAK